MIFTIDVGQRPVLAFEAKNLREAHEMCHESWLLSDLKELRSNGEQLWDGKTKLRARYADDNEKAAYRAAGTAPDQAECDELECDDLAAGILNRNRPQRPWRLVLSISPSLIAGR
ncbi:MAG: hypothetical protein MZV49_22400 [Rhodopseudomonas palustris]|nr:hypothetical protein [Rhodopseudomonas palustris]